MSFFKHIDNSRCVLKIRNIVFPERYLFYGLSAINILKDELFILSMVISHNTFLLIHFPKNKSINTALFIVIEINETFQRDTFSSCLLQESNHRGHTL